MRHGWAGTILNVDLSGGRIWKEELDPQLAESYLGGEALGTHVLYKRVPPGTHPFDERMLFILAAGPGTGTLIPGSGRTEVITKSPLTGILGDSNAGGFFGPELKYAGFDMIVISGKASEPVYLWIDDGRVEIRKAAHLWGKDIWEAVACVTDELGDPNIQTASIGPAGERLITFAATMINRTRAAGRCGTGAVMGSKNLKLVAVRGSRGVRPHDPDGFREACWQAHRKLRGLPVYHAMKTYGTPLFVDIFQSLGYLSVLNYQEGQFDGYEKINAEAIVRALEVKSQGCYGCPISCSHLLEVREGPYKGTRTEGMEFFTTMMFGSMLGIADPNFIAKCHELCSRYGLDVGQTGATMAWVAELYQRGLLARGDLGGLDLTWGNQPAFMGLLEMINRREGIGDLLAQGMRVAGEALGAEAQKYTSSILGQTPPEDFKSRYGVALAHLTSTRGCDQQKGLPHAEIRGGNPEVALEMFGDRDAFNTLVINKKPETVRWVENRGIIYDSLTCCRFNAQRLDPAGVDLQDIARMLTTLTGVAYTEDRLWDMGERVWRLEMAYNAREGRGRDGFRFDFGGDKWIGQAHTRGPWKGLKTDPKLMDTVVDNYLEMRGFDKTSAMPTRKGLEDVGLREVADDMKALGLLVE